MRPAVVAQPLRTGEGTDEGFDRRIGKCSCGNVVKFTAQDAEVVCPVCKQSVAPPVPEIRKGSLT